MVSTDFKESDWALKLAWRNNPKAVIIHFHLAKILNFMIGSCKLKFWIINRQSELNAFLLK
jgi:hypothetical protein